MPRERIGMPPAEVEAFLGAQRWVMLASLEDDGGPWTDLAPCTVDAGELYVAVGRQTRSHHNIERDARVCCAIDEYPSYYEIRGVTVHGRARRIDDPDVRDRLRGRLQNPGVPVADPGVTSSELYALPLDDVFSFDFGKIRERY